MSNVNYSSMYNNTNNTLSFSLIKSTKCKERTPKEQIEQKLNSIWQIVISTYDYWKYYQNNPLSSSSKAKTNYGKQYVFNEYKKMISAYGLSCNKQYIITTNKSRLSNSKYAISSEKIWMMLIMMSFDLSNKNIELIMRQFNEAVNKVKNHIALFELFLIILSQINKDKTNQQMMKKCFALIPFEFLTIYENNEKTLKSIFNVCSLTHNGTNDDYNDLTFHSAFQHIPFKNSSLFESCDNLNNNVNEMECSFSKTFNKGKEHSFSDLINEDEITNMNIDDIFNSDELLCNIETNTIERSNTNSDEDYNTERKGSSHTLDEYLSPQSSLTELRLVCKDYINRGYFAIFLKTENDNGNEYALIPLKNCYESLLEKQEVVKTLELIRKSTYRNYEYNPYSEKVIQRINDMEKSSSI